MDELNGYFDVLREDVDLAYKVASEARAKGLDFSYEVESPLAANMAERVVNLVKTVYNNLPVGILSERILELEREYGKLDVSVAFVIAREIAEGKFINFDNKIDGIDCGLRVGFAYLTLGVVASPIEGYTGLRLGKTMDGKEYFIVDFSGPIRSAGTTAVCLFLFLIDYLREIFGFAKYDPNKKEILRYWTEIRDFHERVSNLAYFPTKEEVLFLAERLPFQIDGDPTNKLEVSEFKDLNRVSTNFIRGGMCLVFGESLALKAGKALGRFKSVWDNGILKESGWSWLGDYVEIHKKRESGNREVEATYIKDLVAGRPVYGHPGRSGSFRFRYGRSRTSGFSGVGIHPATMGVSGGFLSHGTQLRLEKPTKACVVTSCDSIEGPIVRLKGGSVRKLFDYEESLKLYNSGEIEEIIYLGDILFPVGDVIDRNVDLVRPGYVLEWWKEEFESLNVDNEFFEKEGDVDFETAVEISKKFKIPLHPDFIFYWSQISFEEFVGLMRWLNGVVVRGDKLLLNWESGKRDDFVLGKRALEKLGVEHEVVLDNVVIGDIFRAFLFNLGRDEFYNGEVLEFRVDESDERDVLDIVNDFCEVEIKDKAGSFIGARMGRPEKAKLRDLAGSPNVLFPVGDQGGRLKSVQDAVKGGFVRAEFPMFKCSCGNKGIFEKCDVCGKKSKRFFFCRKCNEIKTGKCRVHGDTVETWNQKIEIGKYFEKAVLDLGFESFEVPGIVRGVNNLKSSSKFSENLAKGILRSRQGLSVNKDGTVRYDVIEIPLSHFKPNEIGVGFEKLKELGYLKDIYGEDLVCDSQILELMPHDIVLPSCSVLGKERADRVFLKISKFIDEELERFYGLKSFYNFENELDLVGVKVVCIAPHNCAGVIGRVIGFSNIQGLLASPYMHAAMRRDCDGDEASVILLMDVLLNFSRGFLPSHRGGAQDAALVLNTRIVAGEVDDQILFFDVGDKYPLSFYQAAEKGEHSSVVHRNINLIGGVLRKGKSGFFGNKFTHDTLDFNLGCNNGIYKSLPSMKEKVAAQMELAKRLRGVDEDDVARLVLERHFIRDIFGNLRKFTKQEFRCSVCGEKFRRPPLIGVCIKCEGKLIFTISEGSIRKYLEPAMELFRNYKISSYTGEVLELMNEYIERIFGKGEIQTNL